MSAREPTDRHSDLGPSSKDWLPGSPGRDEDFTPEKDLWTLSRKGDVGEGRPGEDIHSSRESAMGGSGASASGSDASGHDIQPGTGTEGRSWQSREPDPDNPDDKLQQALKDSFPASDPPQPAQPGITGWDVGANQNDVGRAPNATTPRRAEGASPANVTRGMAGVPWRAAALAVLPVLFAAVRMIRRSRRSPRR